MALCRCKNHPAPQNYSHIVDPIGYPDTSSICGRTDCNQPGLIWLKTSEHNQHSGGQRIFSFATNVTKVKVQENIRPR